MNILIMKIVRYFGAVVVQNKYCEVNQHRQSSSGANSLCKPYDIHKYNNKEEMGLSSGWLKCPRCSKPTAWWVDDFSPCFNRQIGCPVCGYLCEWNSVYYDEYEDIEPLYFNAIGAYCLHSLNGIKRYGQIQNRHDQQIDILQYLWKNDMIKTTQSWVTLWNEDSHNVEHVLGKPPKMIDNGPFRFEASLEWIHEVFYVLK